MRWLNEAAAGRGEAQLPGVAAYFAALGHPELNDDDLACNAAVAGLCLIRSGIRVPRSLTAKAYLKVGTPIADPRRGAIAILPVPEDGAALRVGFVWSVIGDQVSVLAGRAPGVVRLETFDRDAIVALRWPTPGYLGGLTEGELEMEPPPAARPITRSSLLRTDPRHPVPLTESVPAQEADIPEPSEAEAPLPDVLRRALARERIKDAVVTLARSTADQQRMMSAHTLQASALSALESVEGDAIDEVAGRTVDLILRDATTRPGIGRKRKVGTSKRTG